MPLYTLGTMGPDLDSTNETEGFFSLDQSQPRQKKTLRPSQVRNGTMLNVYGKLRARVKIMLQTSLN